jgi:hypothetical protein
VLANNGGLIDPARLTRLNGALQGDGSFVKYLNMFPSQYEVNATWL